MSAANTFRLDVRVGDSVRTNKRAGRIFDGIVVRAGPNYADIRDEAGQLHHRYSYDLEVIGRAP